MKKHKILLFLRLPPRLTGATLMNSFVYESQLLQQNFNIKTIRLPHAKSHEIVGKLSIVRMFSTMKAMLRLFFTILIFRPKFVYFQLSPLGRAFVRDLLFVAVIKVLRTKIVYHMHGKGIAGASGKLYLKRLYTFAFKNEEVICLSENLTKDIAGVYNGKPYIVPNVIKNELESTPDRQYSDYLRILFISNIKVSKGIFVFIEALGLAKKKGVSFKARIVGNESGVKKEELSQSFAKHNLNADDVIYVGPKYGDEKWNEFKQSDVLVFPTLNDIWGLVILEAMQAAIPVIASIDGAIPEIIEDNVTGFLVEKQKPDQICGKLEYLFKNPEVSRAMGNKSRERFLATYSYEKFELKMLETFKSVCC